MARTYENFDVELIASGATYEAVFHSIPGEPRVSFGFPLEEHELTAFLAMFGKDQRRRMESPEFRRVRAVGRRLFDSLFAGQLGDMLLQATHDAQGANRGLRIRLDLSDAQDLGTLPWEYLHSTYNEDFVALSNWTPLVRHLDVADPLPATPLAGPLRILVMVSDPIERRGTLDVEREWDQLRQALEGPEATGEIEIARLPDGQLETLMFDLQDHDYHVFHFIGHGEYSEQHDDGVLAFEDSRGREIHVPGATLGTYLRDSIQMRLVVLNNCEGAAFESDPFTGSAQSLLRKGIPAVVAMQFEITDRAAIDFARGFYTSLGKGFPVDAALAEARKVIRAGPTRIEFGSPVLYMSAPDGVLFTKSEEVEIPHEGDEADVVRPLTVKHEASPESDPVAEPEPKPVASDQDQTVEPDPVLAAGAAERSTAVADTEDTTHVERAPSVDGAGADETRPGNRFRMWMAGVLVGIVGIVVLFMTMSRSDDTGANDTTTPSVAATTRPQTTAPTPTATPFVTWSGVTGQASLTAPDGVAMYGVAEGPGGLVSVGANPVNGRESPAAWTSDDGRQWDLLPDAAIDSAGADTAEMRDVVAFGSGFVAVGWATSGDDVDAVVWTSPDGASWARVSSSLDALGGPDTQRMQRIAATETGELVAVGWESVDGDTNAAVWISGDGVDWERVVDATGSFSGPGGQRLDDVEAMGPTLFAVGRTVTTSGESVAAWRSDDGATWQLVEAPELTGSGDNIAKAVSAGPGGLLIGGYESIDGRDAALWLSVDGENWTKVGTPEVLGGPRSQEIHALAQIGSGWVAAGWDHPSDGDKDAAVWASDDGSSWQRIEAPSMTGEGDQQIESLTVFDLDITAVGIDAEDISTESTYGGAVWLGAP